MRRMMTWVGLVVALAAAACNGTEPRIDVSGGYEGTIQLSGGMTATFGLDLTQTGTAVTGSYVTRQGSVVLDAGTVEATIADSRMSGRRVSSVDRSVCDLDGEVSSDSFTISGTVRCSGAEPRVFTVRRPARTA